MEELLTEIENRCKGLTFVSETDAEVHAFQSPHTVRGGLNAASFLKSLDLPPLTQIEERDFQTVLNGQIEMDESGAWETLAAYLEANLTSLTVFAIGEIQLDVYAVGLFTDNEIIGITTDAVET